MEESKRLFFKTPRAAGNETLLGFKDLESILDELMTNGLRHKRLQWYFRSRHEGLITFSNLQYYDNELLTFAEIQMLDVTIPTTDGRQIHMKRHTKPEKLHQLRLNQLGLILPNHPPPEIKARDRPVV